MSGIIWWLFASSYQRKHRKMFQLCLSKTCNLMQTLVPPAFLPKPKGKKVFKLQLIFLHDNKGFCLQYLNRGQLNQNT